MAQFTQLGLSGKGEVKTSENNQKNGGRKPTGALLALASMTAGLFTAFLLTGGCSRQSAKGGGAPSNQNTAQSMPAATTSPVPPASQPQETNKPAHKKSRQHKVVAYKNADYGVSFRYPKYYSLKEGEDANLQWDGLGPVEMNFVQPGGSTLTAVELPPSMYPGTDFTSAFFNVSVNPTLTSAQCGQFAWPQTAGPGDEPLIPEKTKVGVTEFDGIQASAATQMQQADAKYYHIFQNGMCYEFALGVETAASDDPADGIKPVDREQIFRRLNWILSTVKIQPVEVPEVAHATSTPGDNNQ
jgi:hypothetical protein